MNGEFYMVVDPLTDKEEAVVIKKLDVSYLEKTFKEALDYIRLNETDEINQIPYSLNERYGLAKINDILMPIDNGTKSLQKSRISLKCESDSFNLIPVSLDDTISDYADRILLEKRGVHDTQQIVYNLISMYIEQSYP